MNKISRAFENGKAFIAFITCGDPDLETTAAAVRAAAENGADLIELGIPLLCRPALRQTVFSRLWKTCAGM